MSSPDSSLGASRCVACQAVLSGARCDACGAAARVRDYRVLRVVAQGELGRLYLAEDARGQQVALKELVLISAPDIHHLEAFEREAKVLSRLSHPRVPRLFESFKDGEGTRTRIYLAQEFIEGESLLSRLKTHRYSEPEARELARKILSVLLQLHAHVPRIIHRDIKPANLIVRPDGALFLVDLGSARELAAEDARGATMTGTYGYAPLEQLAGHVTEWSDLHAVGATLIHLLTRLPPWEFLQEGKGLVPDRRLDVSDGFRQFIGRLVETDEAQRFATAREALRALNKLGEDEAPVAEPEAPVARPVPAVARPVPTPAAVREEQEVKGRRWLLVALPLMALAAYVLHLQSRPAYEPRAPAPPAVVTAPPETEEPPAPSPPEPTPEPEFPGRISVRTDEPPEPLMDETGFPIRLELNVQVRLESVSYPVLTFHLERLSLSGARGQQRELRLEGYCEEQGTRKRCPRMKWIHPSDETGNEPRSVQTFETHLETAPEHDYIASVRASSRRFLITLGDPKGPDARWTFDVQARRLSE
ncbi:MAG TPA: serine/threonine-protein kinase [Myxococcaceae bacterium]|nr:serine/threonine-protein kinase [Myxococcaceae bacterium]